MSQAAPPGERRAGRSGAGQGSAGPDAAAPASTKPAVIQPARPTGGRSVGDGPTGARPAGWIGRHRRPILLLCLLIVLLLATGTASGVLLRRSLTGNLDRQLRSASDRYAALNADPSDNDHDADDDFDRMVGPVAGTLGAVVAGGRLQSAALLGHGAALPAPVASRLVTLQPGPARRTTELPVLGSYRLAIRGDAGRYEVVGLPLRPVDRAVELLLIGEALVAVLIFALLAVRRRARPAAGPADQAGVQALLAEASHELRTPAAVIHSYAELAEQTASELPPSVDRALQRIESESARMGRMVEDLLVLSRFSGGYRPQLTEVDLTKLVLDAVDDARVAGRPDHWELLAPDHPVEVIGSARWLFQAVAALLSNVRAHTPPGTTVRIELVAVAEQAELTIADDGPGIPAELLPAVFERFVRADDSTRYDGLIGVGLGLSVVREILHAQAGSISVDSSPAGTAFVLRLPLAGKPS